MDILMSWPISPPIEDTNAKPALIGKGVPLKVNRCLVVNFTEMEIFQIWKRCPLSRLGHLSQVRKFYDLAVRHHRGKAYLPGLEQIETSGAENIPDESRVCFELAFQPLVIGAHEVPVSSSVTAGRFSDGSGIPSMDFSTGT